MKVEKWIGFDVTEDHRTYATAGGRNVCPAPDIPPYTDRYALRYPLREWGLDRAACGRIIQAAGLPIPPKSACFFCPSAKEREIADLRDRHPLYYRLALAMEARYRAGRHFRGDSTFTVKAVHKGTKERITATITADGPNAARAAFRAAHDDTESPYNYVLSVHSAVVGLGREFAWGRRIPLDLLSLAETVA